MELATGAISMLLGIVPLVTGLVVFFDPLGRKATGRNFVKIASLGAVPPDGQPYRFPVVADRHDAWNRYPAEPIGSVYLRRTSEDAPPQAFSTICPHLGCSVNFQQSAEHYVCPCHNSAFQLDGARVHPATSPSPRGLDSLEVEIRDGGEVWVDYRRFVGGKSEKIEE